MVEPIGGEAGDGPAVLRLRKWDQSQFQLNLSEFREAVISPTREVLVLLSYQSEALLLPLIAGNMSSFMSMNRDDFDGCSSQDHQKASASLLSSTVYTASSRSDLPSSIAYSSQHVTIEREKAFSHESSSSASKQFPVLYGVKSLVWGHCGDAYKQSLGAVFKELLVVSGNRGVTVHAFRCLDKCDEGTKSPAPDGGVGQGRWVEWGPSNCSTYNPNAQQQFSSYPESSEDLCEVNRSNGTEGSSSDVHGLDACDDSSSSSCTSKRWLRTYLTEAETIESEGKFLLRFPPKSTFPCSAEVVSFGISFNTSIFSKLFASSNLQLDEKENRNGVVIPGMVSETPSWETNSYYGTAGVGSLLKCSKVFSSSSHRLIGIVLTSVEPDPIKTSGEHAHITSKTRLVVAMAYQWGLQWLYSVRLKDTDPSLDSEPDWTDLGFSDKFLVCLNRSGLISFWGVTTGKFVACIDVLQCCGLNRKPQFQVDHKELQGGFACESHQAEDYFFAKRKFKHLMVTFNSSLLAAVDECGVVYLICNDEYILENYNLDHKLVPHGKHHGPGKLAVWQVAGSDIGGQRVLHDISNGHGLNVSMTPSASLSCTDNDSKFRKWNLQGRSQFGSVLNVFSSASRIKGSHVPPGMPLALLGRLFLPISKYSKEDSICFSSLGITRLSKCSIEDRKGFKIVHTCFHEPLSVLDERCLDIGKKLRKSCHFEKEQAFFGEVIGCSFQGCLYLVSQDGVYVVLPSVSVSSSGHSAESICYLRPSLSICSLSQLENLLDMKESKALWQPWKVEVLDRALLYEGVIEADHICLENGWDLKIARMRRLQLALDYLKYDEIEKSLDMLVDVNLSEEGILRLLFTTVYQILRKVGNDNEVALTSRFLALAASFAIKMIQKYGLQERKEHLFMLHGGKGSGISCLRAGLQDLEVTESSNSRRLQEMAQFLEIIRNLQCRLVAKYTRPMVDGADAFRRADTNISQVDAPLTILDADILSSRMADSLEGQDQGELAFPPDSAFESTDNLALSSMESLIPSRHLESENFSGHLVHDTQGGTQRRKMIHPENPKDMIARWEVDNLDLKTVVKDALRAGRLPLAVLQLHLQHLKDFITPDKEPSDTFNEVRNVGRAISYDLFLKGETALAIETLQRLGEEIEVSLRQLVFGTVRRSLRIQVAEEMNVFGYLRPHELKTLERISLIERLYPSGSFWGTFRSRQMHLNKASSDSTFPEGHKLQLTCLQAHNNVTIECGEIDGVVLGSWTNIEEISAFPVIDEDNTHAGYWAGAAVWSDSWNQGTVDRIVLDQPYLMGVHVLWESQLEYHICHNDWEEVSKLLDMIPSTLLSNGSLQISLDGLYLSENVKCDKKFSDHIKYFCPSEELDDAYLTVPNIKIFKFSAGSMCSLWIRMLMEEVLARKLIFMKEYWEGTTEIMPLLARAGFIINTSQVSTLAEPDENLADMNTSNVTEDLHKDTLEALHKLVIHHCVHYNLPNLLDLYLDHHNLVLDKGSLSSLQEAAGDCQWAKWLLLSRIKGCEYEASFSNARSIMSHNIVHNGSLGVQEVHEIICTVDDIAEGGGEMAALATLMYASSPIQQCLSSGSVKRHRSSSAQCTFENLRHGLQQFPTLWRAFVTASIELDGNSSSLGLNAKRVLGKSALSDYVDWRGNIFCSAGNDTSLVQMLPCWFSKAIRRLVQTFVQGPLGWQSVGGAVPAGESIPQRANYFDFNANGNAEFSSISWESAIHKSIEEELFASSFEENGSGVEHHLHRGRPLAAFNHILGARALKQKSNAQEEPSGAPIHGQSNIQSDLQTLLAPFSQNEASLLVLASVMPLAVLHFENTVLVASCALLLELCGLSASMLRVDVVALRRISSFYKSTKCSEHYNHLSPKGSAFHAVSHEVDFTVSLARALADDYQHHNKFSTDGQNGAPDRVAASRRPSRALLAVLQHLEKASLPLLVEGQTCGSWLLSGSGDGTEFRHQQKVASQHWNLVTAFCQMHHLPQSTKYLAILANDNDWVGFLTEAQISGFPFDVVIQVASKEFTDPRLKIHIITVLKSMQLSKKKASSTNSTPTGNGHEMAFLTESNTIIPVELFGLLAECEKEKNPGEELLIKAKDLRWSLLAVVASCFPDVSPLSCLTVWLEITAARETSCIKVNDISFQIEKNVGAAVEATNALPTGTRMLTFRYNRKNPKRRRLIEPVPGNASISSPFDVLNTSSEIRISVPPDITAVEGRKKHPGKHINDRDEGLASLSKMVAVLCEQHLFLPLLRAFEMFIPSCTLLPFIRSLQAFSQMRLTEAAAHMASFSFRIKEERNHAPINMGRDGQLGTQWISSTAVKAADAILSKCPSAYEKRCLLQLLAAADFGDGGSAAACFRRLYWKINLAEPSLRKGDDLYLGNETLDDASLLTALEKNGYWEQARSWARQLESSGGPWKSIVHHVTETQAEAMVAEWKEFLWDVPEERAALWGHCQTLFVRYSFPALQAGLFFLKHAEAVEKDIPARELHEMLLLSLQWLSGTITHSNPVYPLHLLREIETRVWLLAVEAEAQLKTEGNVTSPNLSQNPVGGNSTSIIDQTANIVTKMDNHINAMRARATERNDVRESNQTNPRHGQVIDVLTPATAGGSTKMKRRAKSYVPSRRPQTDSVDKTSDPDDSSTVLSVRNSDELFGSSQLQEENVRIEASFSGWEERVGSAELERAVLSLLEFGQISAAKQLQQKLSPAHVPSEFAVVDAALNLAAAVSSGSSELSVPVLDSDVLSVIQSNNMLSDNQITDPLQVLEAFATKCTEGSGRGLCKRIIAVVKSANVLGLSFSEAFGKRPIELLQLLSLKAQDSFEQAKLLVQTHFMPPSSIARILAESFLKGLLAAHRGGYMDSQKEEGPAPLLWRISDFLKWAELCPSEPEIGHALMRLVITGQEIPHACEVELLILSHHFYKSSACLDGVDVLVSLAAARVESYVSEGDFSCLARLVTGVSNFHALNFILGILIENGQLELLLHKYSAADTTTGTAESVRGFRMAVLTSLKHSNPHDLDAFAMVYNHFDMKHETASLLESRATQSIQSWLFRYDREQNEDLLESMRYFIEAAEVHSTIDAGNKTRHACAQAFLLSLQIRIPDFDWLNLSETNARRALVEQSRFQEALIVAEAYGLNQPSEWALVLWNQMLKPDLTEQFVAEFVSVLPLQPSMLGELARFYRAEVAARGDQSHFSVWLSPGGLPAEWARHLGRSFRSLLKRTRDLRLRMQLASAATGFSDVIDACMKILDKMPDTAVPLVLRKGHGGAYLPLM
ncbi:hypothetical protein AAC387_Pa11g0871 [Persea americana]